jgi:hypothetical protein
MSQFVHVQIFEWVKQIMLLSLDRTKCQFEQMSV